MTDETKEQEASTALGGQNERLVMRNARIKGTHRYSYRAGVWAEILGVKICKPPGQEERAAYKCLYDDGFIDYIPVSDSENYEIDA